MKILICLALFFLRILVLFGQDYMPVNENCASFYYDTTKASKEIYGIRIDSSRVIESDTYYYFNTTWNYDDYSCIKTNGPSWLGSYFIKTADGDYNFFNLENELITIKSASPVGMTWNLYTFPNGDYFLGEITKIESEIFLGLCDSVKYIEIKMFKSNGSSIESEWNGHVFKISRNYGFVEIGILNYFPDKTYNYNLFISGKTEPNVGKTYLTYKDIYNYDVGDEFHYSGVTIVATEYYNESKAIHKVIEKHYSDNLDTVFYTIYFKCKSHTIDFQNQITKDTIFERSYYDKYLIKEDYFLPYEPYICNDDNEISLSAYKMLALSSIDSRRIFTEILNSLFRNSNDSCWEEIPTDGWIISSYLEGCGLESMYMVPFGNTLEYETSLCYYKKGNETFGTPLDFTSIIDPEKTSDYKIFPNPINCNEFLNIENSGNFIDLKIVDYLGNVFLSLNSSFNDNLKIDLKDFSPGFYFVIITTKTNDVIVEKLIVTY